MSKRKSQTAIADYRAQGYIREALVNFLAPAGLVERHRGGDLLARRAGRALRPGRACSRAAPSSTRSASSGSTASGSAGCPTRSWSSGRCRSWSTSLRARPRPQARTSDADRRRPAALMPMVRERLPTLAAIGRWSTSCSSRTLRVEPAALVPKRWDAATTLEGLTRRARVIAESGEVGLRGGRAGGAAPRRWPRSAAGRRATCSWPSASRSPAGPPRRRCSTTVVALGYERTLERLDRAREALVSRAEA